MSQQTEHKERAKKVQKTPDELIKSGIESITKAVEQKVAEQSQSPLAKTIANELKKAQKKVQDGKSKSDRASLQNVVTKHIMTTTKMTQTDAEIVINELLQFLLNEKPTPKN